MIEANGIVERDATKQLIERAFDRGDAVILCDQPVARSVSYHSLSLKRGTEWAWSQRLPELVHTAVEAGSRSISFIVDSPDGIGLCVRLWCPVWEESLDNVTV